MLQVSIYKELDIGSDIRKVYFKIFQVIKKYGIQFNAIFRGMLIRSILCLVCIKCGLTTEVTTFCLLTDES